ncbi:putative transposable element encoded protein [Trachipleistophora hominis]|uniref:Putative transposable element encoded protein n=1 Tax=Trachipleistophora hominis TaxID=72359 RepID=L7JW96_TRAHO|nr:putative transposable element encoded protein [Trachipleistophora hominis]
MLGCQELNIYEDPLKDEFLGVFLGGGCHASHDLRVKVTVAVATYLSVVMMVRAKTLCGAAH